MPRLFECIAIQQIIKLKNHLPSTQECFIIEIFKGISEATIALVHSMQRALNSDITQQVRITNSQKILLTLSNSFYIQDKVLPYLSNSICEIFKADLSIEAGSLNERNSLKITDFRDALKKYFIQKKADKFEKIIKAGISYTDDTIGVDACIFYKHMLGDQKIATEIRPYVYNIVSKFVRLVEELKRKCPLLRNEIELGFSEEIADL